MNETDPTLIDEAEKLFLARVGAREKKRAGQRLNSESAVARKSQQLIPFRNLLKRLIDRGVVVSHCERSRITDHHPPQTLNVYENLSSPRFMPGVSIYLDHPAQIEIAVPNDGDIDELGVVVICCATPHSDANLLRGPFRSLRAAVHALSEFLAGSTLAMNGSQDPHR